MRRAAPFLALSMLALAPPAAGGAQSDFAFNARTCEAMLRQADEAIATRPRARRIEEAKRHREAGARACAEDRYKAGTHDLQRALRALGVKPTIR